MITYVAAACDDAPPVCHLTGCGFPVRRAEDGNSFARLSGGETVKL